MKHHFYLICLFTLSAFPIRAQVAPELHGTWQYLPESQDGWEATDMTYTFDASDTVTVCFHFHDIQSQFKCKNRVTSVGPGQIWLQQLGWRTVMEGKEEDFKGEVVLHPYPLKWSLVEGDTLIIVETHDEEGAAREDRYIRAAR